MKILILCLLIGSIAAINQSNMDFQEVATSRASAGCIDRLPAIHRDCKKLSCPRLKSQCYKTLKQVVGNKLGKQCQNKIKKRDANKKIYEFCAGSCTMCSDGQWTAWEQWTDCTKSCGSDGIQTKTRTCNNPAPAGKGNPCVGPSSETKGCELKPCPNPDDFCQRTTCTKSQNEQCSDCPADACLLGSQCIHYNPKFPKEQFFQGCIKKGGTDCSDANLETTTTDQPRPTPEPNTTPAPETASLTATPAALALSTEFKQSPGRCGDNLFKNADSGHQKSTYGEAHWTVSDCAHHCDSDPDCTGFNIPVNGQSDKRCETYTYAGVIGDGVDGYQCYSKKPSIISGPDGYLTLDKSFKTIFSKGNGRGFKCYGNSGVVIKREYKEAVYFCTADSNCLGFIDAGCDKQGPFVMCGEEYAEETVFETCLIAKHDRIYNSTAFDKSTEYES